MNATIEDLKAAVLDGQDGINDMDESYVRQDYNSEEEYNEARTRRTKNWKLLAALHNVLENLDQRLNSPFLMTLINEELERK